MNSVITALVVGVITYLGRVARGKQMSIDLVVGIGGLAVALALVEQADKDLAKKFGLLVIIGVLLAHWQVIVSAAGFRPEGVVAGTKPGFVPKYTNNGVNISTPSRVGGK